MSEDKFAKESGQTQLTIDEAFAQAIEHFNAERYTDADSFATAIINVVPDHIDAINMQGVVAQKLNRHDIAVERFGRALDIDNSRAMLHYNLAISLYYTGQQERSVKAVQTAIKIVPDNSQFRNFLNNVLKNPTPKKINNDLANEAARVLQLGISAHSTGDIVTAVDCYNRVLAIDPMNTAAICNLGAVLQQQGKHGEAVEIFNKAIKIKPDLIEAHSNLGNTLLELGRVDEGIDCYLQAISIDPSFASAHNNLGKVWLEQGRLDDAVLCYQTAIKYKPDMAEAHHNLGVVFNKQGLLDKAICSLQKAIAIKPDYAEALCNLGQVFQEQSKYSQAVASYKKALTIKPDFTMAHSNMIFCIDLIPDISTDLFKTEREQWNRKHAEPLRKYWPIFKNVIDSKRVLRVGYVNADFKHHSASHIFGPVLLNHDKNNFQIFCYAGNTVEDDMTQQFKDIATEWVSTYKMDDATLAAKINSDKIDILVDTAGHTRGNRLMVFARKPAPIQITAWGYPHGTAMAAMDYLFADPIFIPTSQRNKYTEEIVDLSCVIHLNPYTTYPDVSPPPVLKNGYITFGGFNRLEKYSNELYLLWVELLQRLPHAKLLMKTLKLESTERKKEIESFFVANGIEKDRLILIGRTTHQEHLQMHGMVDIMLDPFPHNGGMTTLESVRMGVPVLTCEKITRCPTSASILHIMGMDEWRAEYKADFLAKAVDYASDINKLKTLRTQMRSRFDKSVLGNGKLYTREIEAVYRKLWKRWCEKNR
ncbi:MAG: tetratricopeptide repeat protein [Magnetococcales bacterium]|nr:tetratricopeptide repeat protein [Magnetococcales bacterium]